jgi:NADH-quinone oxidoreductase subunit A
MTTLVLFLLIFLAAGLTLLAANLVLGWFVRPDRPTAAKSEVYECGEQPVGPSWIQFDLRFYVVALLFVIFDVELAFFFPWAVVFGSATKLADATTPPEQQAAARQTLSPRGDKPVAGTDHSGSMQPGAKTGEQWAAEERRAAKKLAWIAFADILVFFGVLLVGFAYLWRRGDLEWVRSLAAQAEPARQPDRAGAVP